LRRKQSGVIVQRPGLDGGAQLAHQRQVVMQVVDRGEARAEDLVDPLQVVQVRAREVPAGIAVAGGVERSRVVPMYRVADSDIAEAREEPAVTRIARGQHAVEHVDARDDAAPLDPASACPASRDYSKAYLHHLVKSEEILGQVLLSWHNLAFFQTLMAALRGAIATGTLEAFRREFAARQAVR